jgi:hypothetical protein
MNRRKKIITDWEVAALVADPLNFAMMMSDEDLEEVIARFVGVLNKRNRGSR